MNFQMDETILRDCGNYRRSKREDEMRNSSTFGAICNGYKSKTFNFAEIIDGNSITPKSLAGIRSICAVNKVISDSDFDELDHRDEAAAYAEDSGIGSQYFLRNNEVHSIEDTVIRSDDVIGIAAAAARREIAFTTFRKTVQKAKLSRKCIDEIFDDGRTEPVRPVRRKRASTISQRLTNTNLETVFCECEKRNLVVGPDGGHSNVECDNVNEANVNFVIVNSSLSAECLSGSDEEFSLKSFANYVRCKSSNSSNSSDDDDYSSYYDDSATLSYSSGQSLTDISNSGSSYTMCDSNSGGSNCQSSSSSIDGDIICRPVRSTSWRKTDDVNDGGVVRSYFGLADVRRPTVKNASCAKVNRHSFHDEYLRAKLEKRRDFGVTKYVSALRTDNVLIRKPEADKLANASSTHASFMDDLFALRWAARCGILLTNIEQWLLDVYLVAFDDAESEFVCQSEDKWFSSNDEEGRVYYFEENSSESSWTLPSTISTSFSEKYEEQTQSLPDNHIYSNLPVISRSTINTDVNAVTVPDNNRNRPIKSKSMILTETKAEEYLGPFASKNWPQLLDGQMSVLKEGPLNRTKITENGKRLRKNWSSSHVVLTELLLLFFKDAKSFAAGISGPGRPEISVDLNGAVIDKGDKVSSRKNVYIVSTVLGTQVLIQNDCTQQAQSWQAAIQSAINNLPSSFDSCPRFPRGFLDTDDTSVENESKKFYKVTRSKSVKAKSKEGSIEDLTVSSAERQTKIKARLKKFFNRRPTMESLVKKGIWKDEPAFGCYLDKIAGNDSPRVPLFVRRCISCIERSEENMKTDGLYRASGNLSQVQKIRLQVDQNNLSVIEEEEDVHVLTGALKLFFRELKEPLIPYQLFHKAIKASNNHSKKEKISQFREITKALPTANYDTLRYLLQHLLRVTKYKEFNRMHIPNLAIVFGPTLMWPEQESNNMALDLMQQNLVIECLLVEYENIFR